MKKVIIVFLLVVVQGLFAQNKNDWFPLPQDQVSFFNPISSNSYYGVLPIRIDSIKQIENNELYFNIRNPVWMFSHSGGSAYDPMCSWLGYYTILNGDKVVFLNKNNDSIFIYPQRVQNDKWELYNYENGDYIEALVESSNEYEFIEGLVDSIKIISLTYHYSDGSINEDQIFPNEIILSKSHGIFQTFNMAQFPSILNAYTMIGLEKDGNSYGFKWDYNEMVLGYEVGDIIQLVSSNSNFDRSSIVEYLQKEIGVNYVEYTLKVTGSDYRYIRTETKKYNLDLLPGQSLFSDFGDGNNKMINFILLDEEWNGGNDFVVFDRIAQVEEIDGKIYWIYYLWQEGQYQLNNSHYFYRYQGAGPYGWEIGYVDSEKLNWGQLEHFSAGDYSWIRPEYKSIYEQDNEFLEGINIKAITGVPGVPYSRNFTNYSNGVFMSNEDKLMLDSQANWYGKSMGIFDDGSIRFENAQSEVYNLNANGNEDSPWLVYEGDEYQIKAVVVAEEYQEIFQDLSDSLKLISMYSLPNEGNINLNDSVILRLSKNYGLLDIPGFYNFDFDHIYHISAIYDSGTIYGRDYGFYETFGGLVPGSQKHYQKSEEADVFYRSSLISSNVSSNKVDYIFDICRKQGDADAQNYTDTISYPITEMPGEIIFDEELFGQSFFVKLKSDSLNLFCDPLYGFYYKPYVKKNESKVNGRVIWEVEPMDSYEEDGKYFFSKESGSVRLDYMNAGFDIVDYYSSINYSCGSPYAFSCETGIEEIQNNSLVVFPNPTTAILKIQTVQSIGKLSVYNIYGVSIIEKYLNDEYITIDLKSYPSGIYFVDVLYSDGSNETRKFIKK